MKWRLTAWENHIWEFDITPILSLLKYRNKGEYGIGGQAD